MGNFTGNPPLSTDSGSTPAPDLPAVNAYSPETVYKDTVNAAKAGIDDLKGIADDVVHPLDTAGKLLAWLVKVLLPWFLAFIEATLPLEEDWIKAIAELYQKGIPIIMPYQEQITQTLMNVLLAGLGESSPGNLNFGSGGNADLAQRVYTDLIGKFTLFNNTADLTKPGSGMQNVQFLLQQSLMLALMQYDLDRASEHVGMGWLKNLQPLMWLIDKSLNPSNVVRMSMEQGYSYLMKAPLQRDLNRKWPIKNLGVSALAKLYVRGAIDQNTYLDRCLDAGLSNEQAQQNILESANLLSTSDIAKLLNKGYITSDDAKAQYKELGYPEWQADALLYLESNSRYFSYQESVGKEAVTAWKHGYIDQTQLESLLQTLHFTDKEIQLLEIEGTFTKNTTDQKTLSYSQVHSMFESNIVDLDYVINYLTTEGYAPDDVTKLVLLDFVKAEERALKEQELVARIRVQEQSELASAAVEANKNEIALADARKSLAAELDSVQHQLGLLQSLPSIMDLIGISLP